jgi:hypothetical protein
LKLEIDIYDYSGFGDVCALAVAATETGAAVSVVSIEEVASAAARNRGLATVIAT